MIFHLACQDRNTETDAKRDIIRFDYLLFVVQRRKELSSLWRTLCTYFRTVSHIFSDKVFGHVFATFFSSSMKIYLHTRRGKELPCYWKRKKQRKENFNRQFKIESSLTFHCKFKKIKFHLENKKYCTTCSNN